MELPPLPVQPLPYEPLTDQSWRRLANTVSIFLIIWSAVGICRAGLSFPQMLHSAYTGLLGTVASTIISLLIGAEGLGYVVALIAAIACLRRRRIARQVAIATLICVIGLTVVRQGIWHWQVTGARSFVSMTLPVSLLGTVNTLLAPALAVALLMHREVRRVFETT